MKKETVLVLDFGGQYNQLIARRVRDMKVYSELVPCTISAERVKEYAPIGLIFTGGPLSAFSETSPKLDPAIFELGIPVLGICYGMQVTAYVLGGNVESGKTGEYGRVETEYSDHLLFDGVAKTGVSWMSHTDIVSRCPAGFKSIAKTANTVNAAFANDEKRIYGLQFHPEVVHTAQGLDIMRNFVFGVCGASGDWDMKSFVDDQINILRAKLKGKKVLLGLSGGVDSSVCAAILHKAVPEALTCVFVDHGLLRKGEAEEVQNVFGKQFGINLITANAQDIFLKKLRGVKNPEHKRKIIGKQFIKAFEREAKKIGAVNFLAQGTIYPDIVESGAGGSAVIKSHHNVGGLPDRIGFEGVIEPLRDLFKDEVRRVGFELGLPEHIVMRQPFPGPGLGIRIIGNITREKLDILRETDYIYRDEIAKAGLDKEIWQYFTVLTNMRSVGVMGDHRTYDYTVALRAVNSIDAMSADWFKIPYDVLDKCSARIVNEVKKVNRIVYDITSKPPATIEWE
ncbi:MAG: glutamine-hydrolyzing GMP synthase [Clostridiaceae bacterium]|jgi:GMP synthase (glutamine-hydrolysing)|nr:glutamine-hydrolyzing GMP synthase [Clostridiaceae bacterium]